MTLGSLCSFLILQHCVLLLACYFNGLFKNVAFLSAYSQPVKTYANYTTVINDRSAAEVSSDNIRLCIQSPIFKFLFC